MHVLPGPAGHNDDDGSLVKTCLGPGLGCNLGHKLLKSSFLFKVVTDSKSEAEPASQSRRLGPRQPEHSQAVSFAPALRQSSVFLGRVSLVRRQCGEGHWGLRPVVRGGQGLGFKLAALVV